MDIEKALAWIDRENEKSLELLAKWASINSWSKNSEGLAKMAEVLKEAFSPLADTTQILGNSLLFEKRDPKILLGGHMDTVFPSNFPVRRSRDALFGPGVADMKGGLLVLLLALSAFERFRGDLDLGWRVLINSDEEMGSPSSENDWKRLASLSECALLFEPAYPDGAFVDSRKGSYTASVVVKGTPAHVGRDFEKGKSAVIALSQWINKAHLLNYPDTTLNIAALSSSSAINIIPEVAGCTFNVRSFHDLEGFKTDIEQISKQIEEKEGVKISLIPEGSKPPKPWTDNTAALFEQVKACALKLNIPFQTRPSGGLCDGNFIAGMNVPCIDTLGVVGGGLHTPEEYMVTKSLAERAKLTCLFLFEYANHK